MSSTKGDLNRGTYSQPTFDNFVSVTQSKAKVTDVDLNVLFVEQQNDVKRFPVQTDSNGRVIKREIQYNIKKELQRSFHEQVNKLLE